MWLVETDKETMKNTHNPGFVLQASLDDCLDSVAYDRGTCPN